MKKLTLSLLYAGLISTTAIAEDICEGAFQAQNYQQSAACYVQQLKKERTFNNLEYAGISYENLGRYSDALLYLKEAETNVKKASDYGPLYSHLGIVYSYLGDTTKAFAYKMKALNLSLKSGNRENIALAYNNMGSYYHGQKQPKEALEYFEKSLGYSEESQQAATYNNMALIYDELNNYQKSETMFLQSIDIAKKESKYNDLGHFKLNLGIFYFNHNRLEETLTTLKDARMLSHDVGNLDIESQALSYLAIFYYRDGKLEQAKENITESLRLAKQSNSPALSSIRNVFNYINGKQ